MLKDRGRDVPALDNKPELDPYLGEIWNAFTTLHAMRQSGFGANPLSMSDIVSFMDFWWIRDESRRGEWFYLIRSLDREWLDHVREKNKAKEQQADAKSPGSDRRQAGTIGR